MLKKSPDQLSWLRQIKTYLADGFDCSSRIFDSIKLLCNPLLLFQLFLYAVVVCCSVYIVLSWLRRDYMSPAGIEPTTSWFILPPCWSPAINTRRIVLKLLICQPISGQSIAPIFQVHLVKTSCGDAHNIAFDADGRAYSLPSPLDFNPFPSDTQHKVSSLGSPESSMKTLQASKSIYDAASFGLPISVDEPIFCF